MYLSGEYCVFKNVEKSLSFVIEYVILKQTPLIFKKGIYQENIAFSRTLKKDIE